MMLFEMLTRKMLVYFDNHRAAASFIEKSVTVELAGEDTAFWREYFKSVFIGKIHDRPSVKWCLNYFRQALSPEEFESALNKEKKNVFLRLIDAGVASSLKENMRISCSLILLRVSGAVSGTLYRSRTDSRCLNNWHRRGLLSQGQTDWPVRSTSLC
jgi:hypothetical protein